MGIEELANELNEHMLRVKRRIISDALITLLLGIGAVVIAVNNDFMVLSLIAAAMTGAAVYSCFARYAFAGLGCRTRYWAHELHQFYSAGVRGLQEKHGLPVEDLFPEITASLAEKATKGSI